mmetsp:Transcript_33714/g.74638  ORF Transcript_33714/g.74638 Transcript_33714/m.74638 type:complete len:210 (-) Transcript_33714:112-741(-)
MLFLSSTRSQKTTPGKHSSINIAPVYVVFNSRSSTHYRIKCQVLKLKYTGLSLDTNQGHAAIPSHVASPIDVHLILCSNSNHTAKHSTCAQMMFETLVITDAHNMQVLWAVCQTQRLCHCTGGCTGQCTDTTVWGQSNKTLPSPACFPIWARAIPKSSDVHDLPCITTVPVQSAGALYILGPSRHIMPAWALRHPVRQKGCNPADKAKR